MELLKTTELIEYIDLNYSDERLKDILIHEINFNCNTYITPKDIYNLFDNLSNYILLKNSVLYDLLEFILEESTEDLSRITYKIDLKYYDILLNKHISLNQYNIYQELYETLYSYMIMNDLYETPIYSIYEYHKTPNTLNIDIDDDINCYKLFEEVFIEFYNSCLNTNIKYVNNEDDEYYLIISIEDILNLNLIILDNLDKTYITLELLDNDIDYIEELFLTVNNSINSEVFLNETYSILSEKLFNEYYEEYWYNINNIKFHSVLELNGYVLNILKHYNLNKSFEFKDSIYTPW